ncbi:efflux RND transporter permease subunit [Anaeromicrobium sediminis]|uniref:Transporter n=1 Tax=Anaeromicrobium sediminis TaxID=1478221 RepID=A0A267MLF7_9FIRM|nr:efflux RND transporter permease subunit [Anaeromicrobium sediminis]PAB59633.1 hypothetical protein CCE28_08675 [Anaeromicrobium sediminis]
MKSIIKKLIEKRVIVMFLAVLIALGGAFSYHVLPRQESPDVSAPFALIITPYPGASPNDVKQLVTKKIEDKMIELDGFDKVEGTSKEGLSIVTVAFDSEVNNDKAMQDVRNAVADAQAQLPGGTIPSEVNTNLIETAGIIISLSGDNYTYEQLESFGELFKDKLADVDGVSKFSIEGKVNKEVKIVIDIEKLNQYGIGIDDVDSILQAQNIEIPSGDIAYGKDKITVKTPGIFTSIKDVENTIIGISSQTGSSIRLRDVADVYMGLEDGAEKYKQNGKNAVLLTGYFKDGKNVVLIGKDVRIKIDEVKAQLPEDLKVDEVIYQPDDVAKSVNDFMINLVEGVLLVVVVVFLGLGMRNALVVSAAIPMSILITFIVMYLSGIRIHQMSLTALIVALGILVDNAIVISDTIQVRIDNGENPLEASEKGTILSSLPIFTATLTTIAAFSPLLGLPGVAGDFLKAIPQVLIISIIAAYVVSMFITPAMCAMLFKKSKKKNGKEGTLRKFFSTTLKSALKRSKVVTIGIFVILILVVKTLMPQLPSEFFPYTDKNVFYVEMNSEASSNVDATEELTDEVVNLLKTVPEVTNYTVAVGNGLPKFYISMPPALPSSDYGQMLCKFDLEKGDNRFNSNKELINHIQELLDENISTGVCKARLLANAKPADAKAILKLSGDNLDRLTEVANLLKKEISTIEGVASVEHNMKDKIYQIEVDVDEDKAINMGITKYDVQKQINMALYGKKSSVYRKNGKEYNIKVESNIKNISMLENMKIKSSMTGKKVPLKQFAAVGYSGKLDTISTYNRDQTVTILVKELPRYNPTDLENTIEFDLLPKLDTTGTKIMFDGEREEVNGNFSVVGLLAGLSIVIIYIILVIQFDSFIQPVVILTTVPLSLIGSIVGLYLFKQPLSLTAFLGIIALVGLVVKNGILLIEYMNESRENGYNINEACIDAVDKRFNAIILSAGTTIIGLIPLALANSSLFTPMAVSLMFGLLVSTFLTMVVIPVIYSLIETFLMNRRKRENNVSNEITE